ncbi:hypothetical protein IGI04_022543 [Brassica rapa subsp. trilocularis]|uniref:RNase H type-1 domain-containing protein n=1 Tax=Brassica rapa subsp. trilocularis TaxID=1813537 RepID=A0ABQ7M198_BRACM|nr:hypothetical protein IGI04_022543 [Brassica rapa subsp. trilocularis]
MSKGVTRSKVCFQGREANRVADKIAKEAISLEISAPKLYTVMPIWLKTYVENDLLLLGLGRHQLNSSLPKSKKCNKPPTRGIFDKV